MRSIDFKGEKLPIDFSIMTVLEVCEIYSTDPTGIADVFSGMKTLREQMQFVINVGVIALNDGAKREGDARRYNEFTLREMLTEDMTLSERIINGLFSTFQAPEVFPTPTKESAKKNRKGGR